MSVLELSHQHDGKEGTVDATELHAADDLNVSLVWADFERLFMQDRNSLVGMLLEVRKQMTYPSTAPISSPRKSRAGWARRLFNLKG